MQLTWIGHAAFKLTDNAGFTVITDPYQPDEVGYPDHRDAADLVLMSSDDDIGHCRGDLVQGNPVICNTLDIAADQGGAATVAGLDVRAIAAEEWFDHPRGTSGQNAMFRFEMDGLKIAHMGDVGNPLSPEQTAFFEDTDILLALAGGPPTLALPDLMGLIHTIKPRLTIPMHFRTLTYSPRNTFWIESFLSGFEDAEVDFASAHTVSLMPADLPGSSRVLVMDYQR